MKLIKNGTILTERSEFQGDILIEGEKIKAIGNCLESLIDRVSGEIFIIDARGKYIFPGGVDEHTHFGSFGGRLFETTDAAAVGGTTTIVDFAPQERGDTLAAAVERHAAKAKGISCVDYGFHSMVMDLQPDTFRQIKELPQHGVSCLKMFMAYKGTSFYVEDKYILQALEEAKKYGITVMVHAESSDMIAWFTKRVKENGCLGPEGHYLSRPPITEIDAVQRAIAMAKAVEAPIFIVHVTTKGAMEAIREACENGLCVYGETCMHYLALDESYLQKPEFEGAKYVCSPPLRSMYHQEALWEAIGRGWLNAVSSDHCALCGGFDRKKEGKDDFSKIPSGVPGVQDRIVMLWSQGVAKGRISKQRFVELIASAPAQNAGLLKKGKLMPGFDADLVIYDPDYRGTIMQANNLEGIGYNIFEGFEMIGRPKMVLLRGEIIAQNGKFIGKRGCGKRIYAEPYGTAYEHYGRDG